MTSFPDQTHLVERWLQNLGLARYVPVFKKHEVDWDTLPELTEADLLSMQIEAVGSRRKLLSAITTLRTVKSMTYSNHTSD